MRDSQRSKLYGWELAHLESAKLLRAEDTVPLGEKGAQDLVRLVWLDFRGLGRMPAVKVLGNRGRGWTNGTMIKLSSQYLATQTRWYVLHELAHCIMIKDGRSHLADHGPEFCAVYADLLDTYATGWRPELVGSMKGAGLKVS
tara:strand:+ start:12853 stop:13281 length:429 start_codon:yes stop_codon:yes gene_type:complete